MQAWEADGTALVVSERLLNCPPQLAPPLQQALFEEEIPWATEDEPSQELRDSFRFTRYLMASRAYADASPAQPSAAGRRAGAPGAKRKKVTECWNRFEAQKERVPACMLEDLQSCCCSSGLWCPITLVEEGTVAAREHGLVVT